MAKFQLKKMPLSLYFIVGSALLGAVGSIMAIIERNTSSDRILRYTTGNPNSMPGILTVPLMDKVGFFILNHDPDNYPMLNVKAKINEDPIPDIGILYPEVNTEFYTMSVPFEIKDTTCSFVIWYNNSKSLIADVVITRRKADNFLETKIKYVDSAGVEYRHPWQKTY